MMARLLFLLILFAFCLNAEAQDMPYTRQVIKTLCSQKYYGRGYLRSGVEQAAEFLKTELQKAGAEALLPTGYFQWFEFDVNTFPGNMQVRLNNKLLKPGIDYIPHPSCPSIKGRFQLSKVDSLSYTGKSKDKTIHLRLTRKLTFSVATNSVEAAGIDLLVSSFPADASYLDVQIESRVKVKYINKNVCAFVPGTVNNDSCLVFTAHYDHLGGIGKNTFFPGANDNASGVSMLLNLVKHYKAYPPKYKTVFLFFAGEEAGLLGSKHFVEQNTLDPKRIKFLINLDLLGTGEEGLMVVNGAVFEKEFQKLERINTEQQYLPAIKKRGKAKNSDHYWFTEAGVPCFFMYTMGGIKAYHDVYDVEKTLPLTEYQDVFKLLTDFVRGF